MSRLAETASPLVCTVIFTPEAATGLGGGGQGEPGGHSSRFLPRLRLLS